MLTSGASTPSTTVFACVRTSVTWNFCGCLQAFKVARSFLKDNLELERRCQHLKEGLTQFDDTAAAVTECIGGGSNLVRPNMVRRLAATM